MSTEEKIDRKALRRPDFYVERGRQALAWMVAQRVRFLPILAVTALVIAGLWFWDLRTKNRQRDAWEAYFVAQKVEEARRGEEWKSVQQRYSDTRAGLFAAVAVADIHYNKAKGAPTPDANDLQQAAEWYGKALTYSHLLPLEKQLLLINRAGAYSLGGKYDEAAKDLELASGFTTEAKPLALLELGRIYEAKKDPERAKATYEKLAADSANTEAAKLGQAFRRRMHSALFDSTPATAAAAAPVAAPKKGKGG